MKTLVLLALIFFSGYVFSQEPIKKEILLEGYIFTEDSLPVESAYLINYRTSKIAASNNKGFFRITLQQGDSIMINHISLTPKVIYAEKLKNEITKIYIPYRTYILKAISSGIYEKEKKNVDESMKQVKKDIQNQVIIKPYLRTNENPYDNDKQNPGVTIPLLQIGSTDKKKTPPEE
jgi:hypothetical protein